MLRILNVGCGDETYGNFFLDKYPLRDGIIKFDADIDKIPYPDNYFDRVYSKNLFEHLTNPSNLVSESFRVLKEGGIIEIITDNAEYKPFYWRIRLSKALNYLFRAEAIGVHNFGYNGYGDDDKHFGIYTINHLYNHLERKGFFIYSSDKGIYQNSFEFTKKRNRIRKIARKIILKLIISFSILVFGYPRIRVIGVKPYARAIKEGGG